ncbi:hypothetical protein D3C80_2202970 [compost metagenome]
MQAVARLASQVQALALLGRLGTCKQHHAGRAGVIGNGHHGFGVPPPGHVMHGAIHLAITQAELGIGGKA